MSRLKNKVAVITGGTSGIGLAAAKRFVAEGAFVYIFTRRQEELDKTVAKIGRNVTGVQGDVRKLEDLDQLYAKVASDGRKLDVVVANVGAVSSVKLADVTIESFYHNFDVNARGRAVHGAEVAAAPKQWCIRRPDQHDRLLARLPRSQRLRRLEDRTALLCPDLDDGAEGPRHPGQYDHAGSMRHAVDRYRG
jgi:NAD(P)-dependent dehydrogenase (short-subunit alcohol dehydrogenase family)